MRYGSLTLGLVCAAMLSLVLAAPAPQADPFANLELRNLGPAVTGGRVTTVTGIPGQPGIYYVGAAGGGLWKTTDDGMTWTLLFDKSATIGAVAVAPSNLDDLWVGTGEANPRNDVLTGNGIYHSADNGKTWEFRGLADAGQISRIVINPDNPDVVYAAVLGNVWKPGPTRGIYMTGDAGAHWTRVLYVNDTTGASDLAIDPANPDVLFAGMWSVQRKPWTLMNGSAAGGIWRSRNAGRTWQKLTTGLPGGVTDRIGLAIAPSDPKVIYALMTTRHMQGVLWGSSDGGDHWQAISNNRELVSRPFYFSRIAVSPHNPQKVYFASGSLLVSTDGGKTVHAISRGIHGDQHAVWIDPKNPSRLIEGNDGGAYETFNDGKSWRYFDNLPIEQLYTVAIGATRPFTICGGLQDNNAYCGPSNSLSPRGTWGAYWWGASTGDGQYIVPAPSDPTIIYSEAQNAAISRIDTSNMTTAYRELSPSTPDQTAVPLAKLKYRFNWTTPIAVSPSDANTLYAGGNAIFKSTDGGNNWHAISADLTRNAKQHQPIAGGPVVHDVTGAENYDTLLSITIAASDPNVIWAGTDDGLVWITRDDGQHWNNVTPDIPAPAKLGRIYQIGASPFSASAAYLAVDAYMFGDEHPYVYKTSDYGQHWTRIDRGLPEDAAAVVVREDPNQRGLLALGTNHGLYISHDDGMSWTPLRANLPADLPVWDLKFTKDPHDLVLATHGRGFWVLDNLQPLEQWDSSITGQPLHLFSASTGIEWREFGSRFIGAHVLPTPTDFVAPNPPSGPALSYYLASAPGQGGNADTGAVTITIRDASGNPVASFHGPGKVGVNRIAWNMRYDGAKPPAFMQGRFFGRGGGPTGPLALPGSYKVSVQVGEHTQTQTLLVTADPRVPLPMAVQVQTLAAGLALRSQVNAMAIMLNRTQTATHILEDVINKSSATTRGGNQQAARDAAVTLKKQLDAFLSGMYDTAKPPFGQLFSFAMSFYRLYSTLSRNGPVQAPNAEQQRYMSQMEAELSRRLAEFNGKLRQGMLQYNVAAGRAGLQQLPAGGLVSVEPFKLPDAAPQQP